MSEEVSEEEVMEELNEEVKEELSAEVPVEKVTHNPEKEEKKVNLNVYGNKRPANTMDRVFSKIANIKK